MANSPEMSEGLRERPPSYRYQQLAGEIEHQILNGTYRVGDRLPSIRRLHRRLDVSISTVYKAFIELEAMGLIQVTARLGRSL